MVSLLQFTIYPLRFVIILAEKELGLTATKVIFLAAKCNHSCATGTFFILGLKCFIGCVSTSQTFFAFRVLSTSFRFFRSLSTKVRQCICLSHKIFIMLELWCKCFIICTSVYNFRMYAETKLNLQEGHNTQKRYPHRSFHHPRWKEAERGGKYTESTESLTTQLITMF